jgi:hypothetical protein
MSYACTWKVEINIYHMMKRHDKGQYGTYFKIAMILSR